MSVNGFQRFLEKLDHFRDEVLFVFIKPYWPRRIVPNHITSIRIIIGITLFIILFFYKIDDKGLILWLFIIGALTDLLDGSVARGTNQVTELGAMLDSTADRLLVLPIAFYSLFSHYKLLLLVLLLFEVINALVSIFYKSKEVYLESNIFGKTKMVLFCFALFGILFAWPERPFIMCIIVLWATIPFSCLSMFFRVVEIRNKIKTPPIVKKILQRYDK